MNRKFTSAALFICAIILTAAFSARVSAQTVLVNYDFASAIAGTPCTATPLTTATGVVSTFTTGGTGGGTCTTPAGTAATAPPAFVANAVNQAVSLTGFAAGSINAFQFQLNGVTNFADYMLFFQTVRTATGPANIDIQYSTNGTTFTTFQTISPAAATVTAVNVDLSAVAAIENQPTVYIRLLGRDGTGANGTFRIDNFQVQATQTLAPTAGEVIVSGRAITATNRGIKNVTIQMTDARGVVRTTVTGANGFYQFEAVAAGETYVLAARGKAYSFSQPTQIVNAAEDATEINFVAYESDRIK